MKIGLVTFFRNYNYGSVLQCFALQSLLEEIGCQVTILNQKESGISWTLRSLNLKIRFLLSCIIYPVRWRKYTSFLRESRRSCGSLSPEVKISFDSFLAKYLHSQDVSFKELCKDESYGMFISGSDQVWSLSAPILNPFMFLRFAPKNKRASYAASTGTHIVPLWYKRILRKYINDYRYVSIRESLTVPSLEQLGCENVHQHIDPTLVRTPSFWSAHTSKCKSIDSGQYLILFFLNKPNPIAIAHIQNIISKTNLPVYSFPYYFEEFERISNKIKKINVRPEEFVKVLCDASIIFTDSFHGVAFSVNLKKEFFVYGREYSSGTDQGSRIASLLHRYGLQNRYIEDVDQIIQPLPDYYPELEKDRIRAINYIKSIIG